MITWMQRHRKYLIVTLWISGGAFIAAGPMFAIGSGSFSGRSADSVAKAGEVEVSVHQLNAAYSQLFSQYNQMFQGKFDESQAKAFGLQQQALRQLTNEALLLNLANEFSLHISDQEVSNNLRETPAFQQNSSFHKETYIKVLKQNRLTPKLYEEDVKRRLLLNKLLTIIEPNALPLENEAVATALYINDKISYKVLDASMITVDASQEKLKAYWEENKMAYMNEPSFKLEAIEQAVVVGTYTDAEIKEAYEKDKHTFTKVSGEIKSLEEAQEDVVATLNAKATNKEALRTYIAYKKEKLSDDVTKQLFTITQSSNPFGAEVYEKISKLSLDKPHLKPQEINGKFFIFKLVEAKPSEPKTYAQAEAEVKTAFLTTQTEVQLDELAKNSVATFTGKTSPFLTRESINKLAPLGEYEAAEFLEQLFAQQSKRGYIKLKDKKIVLFNILEQQLLKKENNNQEKNVLRLKTSLLNDGLLKQLEAHYPVTSYLEGK